MLEKRKAVEIHWHYWRVTIVTDRPISLDMLHKTNRICNDGEPELIRAIDAAIEMGTVTTHETFVLVERS